MSLTSIKVPQELRDRVSRLAHQRRMSQHANLNQLLKEAEEKESWRRMATTSAHEYRDAFEEDGNQLDEDYDAEESTLLGEEAE
ncbi:hypothetical protein [Nesterenkonia ebinurensis]|uniref:hypothetical protein n=1 Tax=Nesterenkonia ebinurensis TaxID=2608252 RepID=UPI00123C7E2B|nr:hypothetical protein [Nesterenkonia ebinurensis]